MTQQGLLSLTPPLMYTTGELSIRTTEPPPQAQQGFAEPTLDNYVHISKTQYRGN